VATADSPCIKTTSIILEVSEPTSYDVPEHMLPHSPKEKARCREFFSWVVVLHQLKEHLPECVTLEVLSDGLVQETRFPSECVLRGNQALAVELLPEICYAEAWLWWYQHHKEAALTALTTDPHNPTPFLHILTAHGWLAVVEEPRFDAVLLEWRRRYLATEDPLLRKLLRKADEELFFVASGRVEVLTYDERIQIANLCLKWRTVVKRLNTDLTRIGKRTDRYKTAAGKEDTHSHLATKYNMQAEDVKLIAQCLLGASSKGKATPSAALVEFVAHKQGRVSGKTVEKLYASLLEVVPSLREKQKNPSSPETLRVSAPLQYLRPVG
jgi:hypothetical protein